MSTIAVRVDASVSIGIGHVMRCLTLADMLVKSLSCKIIFICSEYLPDEVAYTIRSKAYVLHIISASEDQNEMWSNDADQTIDCIRSQSIDWLVVDHYQLDYRWEKEMKSYVNHIMVIDDLANRLHDCDVLLDQNLHEEMNTRYINKVPSKCTTFLGPAYILLRPEFQLYRNQRKEITHCTTVLVNFGGSDPTRETEKLLSLLLKLPHLTKELYFHIVAGPANTRREYIRELCTQLPEAIYYDQADMAQLSLHADFAIGAGGISMWERCFMGVPSAVIIVADNQIESVQEAERLGLIWNLGKSGDINEIELTKWLHDILQNIDLLRIKQKQCMDFLSHYSSGIHPIVEHIKGES
ncbi:UDP-2,4-diacetamido-2,4,6-trideoxy-beta-L-altropyranose hydrolase [Paenibacillus hunanensis]|uniref:UDP-2,4-diacetamido-2,4, 6-trideoxy-beta-L-altropyranose hydrolase n=1 Tax=Paenibacillus hunanensis TaxID=539262 RepID=UPI0020261028|nr:UDP-2,4-diacetamido-2,4,6-trideoxy-beta-L-altropyranose hydrolase [Paenibacillus hunanensis]MCL9662767.1 UDP-2,4-diacetamido-2,4,6-trideoxy-beta-L-altropyranose hydrolase [Paenibacillus hunanensis]